VKGEYTKVNIVIIGAGVAGVTAARGIRSKAPDAEVSMYTDEGYPYYLRPQLPAFLAGDVSQDELFFRRQDWYGENDLSLNLSSKVMSVNPESRELRLADQSRISYDRLLLATGSRPFMPPIEGTDKRGVFVLRTLDDAIAIRSYAQNSKRALVVGAGLLGLEAGIAVAKLGLEVTVLERSHHILRKQLDEQEAEVLEKLLGDKGLRIAKNAVCKRVLGEDAVSGVVLESGGQLEGDLILVSAGVRPNIHLAEEARLEVNRGIIVDDTLQTSHEDIFALGDAAEFEGMVWGIIPAAVNQARVAAATVLGDTAARYPGTIPSTTLKIAGIELTSVGAVHAQGEDEEIRKVDAARGVCKKLVLRDGRIVGASFLGGRKGITQITQLIEKGTDISDHKEELLDEDCDWKQILPSS
jgi:nitrite reductase (NADH) large subunit